MDLMDRGCCCFCSCCRVVWCFTSLLAAAEDAEESSESTDTLPETESVVETSEFVDGDEDLGHEDETTSISTDETSETLATEDEVRIAQEAGDLSDESDRVAEQLVVMTPLPVFWQSFCS